MKHSKAHPGTTSIPIAAILAVLALVRGPWQPRLLLGISLLWGLWLLYILLPRARRPKGRHKRRHAPGKRPAESGPDIPPWKPETDNSPLEALLLCHVNHRISAYLRSAYPGITWEWEEKKPEKLARSGGTGRIRVFGAPDFDHADITMDTQANITCSMLKIVPLPATGNDGQAGGGAPPNRQPVDPQVWYELQGRTILESLVADLNSRGHSHLTLHENGDACVDEGSKEVQKEHLPGFPEKMYWPRLVQVLEGNGLAAEAVPDGIRVSW